MIEPAARTALTKKRHQEARRALITALDAYDRRPCLATRNDLKKARLEEAEAKFAWRAAQWAEKAPGAEPQTPEDYAEASSFFTLERTELSVEMMRGFKPRRPPTYKLTVAYRDLLLARERVAS